MYGLDVILDMQCLSSNHVSLIKCLGKTIFVAPQIMSIDSSTSSQIIVDNSCHKCLVKGAQGYILLFYAKI